MSEEKMLPCPSCGGGVLHIQTSNMFCVHCPNCYMTGPLMFTKESAIKAWNALPRALRWTKEPPAKPGWYWHHMPPAFGAVIEYVDPGEWKHVPAGEWAGPIPEPK